MLETIENIVSGIGSLIETIKTFFESVLTFMGMLLDGVVYGAKVLAYISASGGILTIILSLCPVFLLPFLFLALVKAVLNLVK